MYIKYLTVVLALLSVTSCREKAEGKNIPKAYLHSGKFYEENISTNPSGDSTKALTFYHSNGIISEIQQLDEDNTLMIKKTFDEEGHLYQIIDYRNFYDGDYDVIKHFIGDNGIEWLDKYTIKEFYKSGQPKTIIYRSIIAYANPEDEGLWERYTTIEDSTIKYFPNGALNEINITSDGAYVRNRKIYDSTGVIIINANF